MFRRHILSGGAHMKIAISGLGKMGLQIARKLQEGGHTVIGHDVNTATVDDAATAHTIIGAHSKADVIAQFNGEPAVVWVMIPADLVDSEIADWATILPQGSTLIDGGNSDYRGDASRSQVVADAGSTLLDIGTSGGVWGYDNGFSLMVGGDRSAYEAITSALTTLAAPRGGFDHFGASGSGHYVKMVHNGIEYGMMQSLAEGYQMLREGPYNDIDLVRAGDVWQQSSVITSWLNDLARQALRDNPNLDGIDGVVAESGEARWTIETAHAAGLTLPAIEASLDVRMASQAGEVSFATKLLAALRAKFGGHAIDGRTHTQQR